MFYLQFINIDEIMVVKNNICIKYLSPPHFQKYTIWWLLKYAISYGIQPVKITNIS